MIRVMLNNGKCDYVKRELLDKLIANGTVVATL